MHPKQNKQASSVGEAGSPLAALIGTLCGPILFLLALWFVFGASAIAPVPSAPAPAVRTADIDPSPRFKAMTDPPTVVIGSNAQRCNDCHALVDLSSNDGQPLVQHADIKLNHGRNDRCLSCHDQEDRNRLVGQHGKSLPYAEVAKLCAQCHGPVYNDWTNGTHGKTLGYWDASKGKAHKLLCTECHDPHSPAYQPIRPLPGPNTLRMGEPDTEVAEHISEERNPLLRWRFDEHNVADHGQDSAGVGAH